MTKISEVKAISWILELQWIDDKIFCMIILIHLICMLSQILYGY